MNQYGTGAAQRITPEGRRDRSFFLGASTAGHQVNGNPHNQWHAWEGANAERLAGSAEQRFGWLPNWQDIKAQASDPDNYRSRNGVEHWQHYREDFQMLRKLGLNSFRFSIEWAELEPREGEWDTRAIERYHAYFAELKQQGITPFPNLWHWTQPQWFEAKGGFTRRSNLRYFERFATKVFEEFGAHFSYCFILNEPNVYTQQGFISAQWPPQHKSWWTGYRVYKNLMEAHRRVYTAAKRLYPQLHVGVAHSMGCPLPFRAGNLLDRGMVALGRWYWNYWFVDRIRRHLDFVGINFYMTDYIRGFKRQNPPTPVNDMGWYMEPKNLRIVLEQTYERYKLPVIVSENGLADAHDVHREWWITESIQAVAAARQNGVEVFGYLHWSLLDNFEWAHGWWPKFGLISVDRSRPDMPRTIRKSAKSLQKFSNIL